MQVVEQAFDRVPASTSGRNPLMCRMVVSGKQTP